MHHLSPHPDTVVLITLSAHQTAAPDTPAVTSNTARPANDNSKSNVVNMGKWGNLLVNKTAQQTKEIDTNSRANKEITPEGIKNLLQK